MNTLGKIQIEFLALQMIMNHWTNMQPNAPQAL